MVKVGSVIQVNERVEEWCGCLMIVSEVKSWGVVAGMKVPNNGTAYLRLNYDAIEYIGEAVFVEREK